MQSSNIMHDLFYLCLLRFSGLFDICCNAFCSRDHRINHPQVVSQDEHHRWWVVWEVHAPRNLHLPRPHNNTTLISQIPIAVTQHLGRVCRLHPHHLQQTPRHQEILPTNRCYYSESNREIHHRHSLVVAVWTYLLLHRLLWVTPQQLPRPLIPPDPCLRHPHLLRW